MSAAPVSPPADLQQAIELFRAQFAQQLPQRLAEADTALAACRAAPGNDDAVRELHRVLHRLAGSAGTFGMPAFGDRCRALELQLEDLMQRPGRTATDFDAVAAELAALADPVARG